jgi:PAS domain S-box-containing protein
MSDARSSVILVGRHSRGSLDLLRGMLETEGYEVQALGTGRAVLDAATASPPGLIILGLGMPDMDGPELARLLAETPTTRDVPVLYLTTTEDLRMWADKHAPEDWLWMPVDRADLLHRIASQGVRIERLVSQVADQAADRVEAESSLVEERRASADVVHAMEDRFERAVLDSPFPMIIHAEDGEVIDVNRAWTDITGYSKRELPTISDWAQRAFEDQAQAVPRDIDELYRIGHRRDDGQHRIRTADGTIRVWEFWSAPIGALPDGRRLVTTTAKDVTERVQIEEDLKKTAEHLETLLTSTVAALGRVAEKRDPYTEGHERRVATIARLVATEMGMSEDDVIGLETAALVHDIGKMAVPAEILTHPGVLTDLQFELIRTHAAAGYDILKDIPFEWPVAAVVLQHHERLDGSGYPGGLTGPSILPGARVLAVADVVEAMGSHRPYRAALGLDQAMEELTAGAGIKYGAEEVAACARLYAAGRLLF